MRQGPKPSPRSAFRSMSIVCPPCRQSGLQVDQRRAVADGRAVGGTQRRDGAGLRRGHRQQQRADLQQAQRLARRARASPTRTSGASRSGWRAGTRRPKRAHDRRRCGAAARRGCAGVDARSTTSLAAPWPSRSGALGHAQFEQADVGRRQPAGHLLQFVRRVLHVSAPSAELRCSADHARAPSSSQACISSSAATASSQVVSMKRIAAADRRLAEPPQIGLDHGAELGVAARGLRVAHLDDRLPAVRHLDHAGHDAVRAHFHRRHRLRSALAGQPVAVAVALRRDLPFAGPEGRARGLASKPRYSAAGSTRIAGTPSTCSGKASAGGTRPKPVRRAPAPRAAGAQHVALAQRAPFVAAEGAAHLRAARAQHRRAHRRRPPGTARRGSPRQRRPAAGPASAPGRRAPGATHQGSSGRSSSRARAVGAGQGERAVLGEAHLERKHRHLDAGGAVVVAQQQVARGQRQRGPSHPRCRRPSAGCPCARGPARWPARLAERISIIGSPSRRESGCCRRAAASPAGPAPGRRSAIEVLPMVFQPLGPAEAETPVCAPPIDTAPPGMLQHRHLAPRRRDARVHAAQVAVARDGCRARRPGTAARCAARRSRRRCRPVCATTSAMCGPPSPP